MLVIEIIKDAGALVTAVGIIVAIWTLKENHDWNRRQQAAALLSGWNEKTSVHRRGIERIRPGLLDLNKDGNTVAITIIDAENIYKSAPETEDWQLRFHFIELLNYFEFIAVSYQSNVADRSMVEVCFRTVLIKYHTVLYAYIQYVERVRVSDAWKPFSDVIHEWKKPDFEMRRPTGMNPFKGWFSS